MSELDEVFLDRIAFIVFSEGRPFSYIDFLQFEWNDKEYKMAHGTFRNKISKLIEEGKIEVDYNSNITFYTLKGHRFGKSMTIDHTMVHNTKSNSFYNMIASLPVDKTALHDIRLKLVIKGLYSLIEAKCKKDFNFPINQRSKDICIPAFNIGKIIIRITIHKTDTISIIIACSSYPIATDTNGLFHFTEILTRIEGKLLEIIKDATDVSSNTISLQIPHHNTWIVTMWHFGVDSLITYNGEKFEITYEQGRDALVRVYTKQINKKTKIRMERQEYPKKQLVEAVSEKLFYMSEFQH